MQEVDQGAPKIQQTLSVESPERVAWGMSATTLLSDMDAEMAAVGYCPENYPDYPENYPRQNPGSHLRAEPQCQDYPDTSEANSNRAEQCPQLTRTLMSSRGTLVFLPHC